MPQQLGVDPRTLANRLQGEIGATGGGGDRIVPAPPRQPRGTPQWAKTFSRIALGVGVLVVLFLVTVPAIKEYRVRRRYARARGSRSVAEAAFHEFEMNAAELAAPRRMSESARIHARRVSELKGLPDRPVMQLAAIYEAAEYARDDIPASDAEEARRLAHELRSRLWRNSSWWQRLVRLFSPASLHAPRTVARPAFSALPFTRTT